ncbi:hypothetical protein C7H19_15160 [Aphanothece hegewaldii CCALA 016]|uniref:Macro domain-containing protein n=1 Tax=Aphanothece hegewaldii CCALA 016 TaxID=2107694 RepID=A0A2T1LVL3_9CHRO|nr:hypothetical protein [Aphanothece hegewaldii]PSF35763.1 hypothetical protein C7H19_15160 [Aphanothece hegewaldii CCALA 016]
MVTQIRRLQSEGLPIAHFDTLTGQSGELTTTFKNTIAEYLFPNTTFSLGTVYPKTTEEQLKSQVLRPARAEPAATAQSRSIPSKTLAFANGEKFYFADTEVRHQIFPKDSDGAAYGSIPFTDNRSIHELTDVKVLVIDDETGENNIGLAPESAKKLVGDCHGQISPHVHQAIGGEANTPFQFRIGIKATENSPARIAKGTLAPVDLTKVGDYDLILPKSAFKGRKGEQNQEIQPGEHSITLALGIKTHAYRGEQSLGPQILVNYPKSVEAAIPLVEQRLAKLTQIASDPVALATDYLETTRSRYRFIAEDRLDEKILNDQELAEALLEELGDDYLEQESEIYDRAAELLNKERNYHLIKADLEGHRQLLEHPKVVDLLNKHLQTQYRELATGRAIKFQAALLQPSLDLKEDEFCDPKLPEGVKVIVTRSPFLNSNNFIALTNRPIPEAMEMQGSVYMNPKTAALHLQGDFDGDRVAYQSIPRQPKTDMDRFLIALAAEITEKQLPQNRYADVVKPDKQSYQGSFEAIALSARENQVGIVANQVMKAIALEHETQMLPEQEKMEYINKVAAYFKGKNNLDLPDSLQPLHPALEELSNLPINEPVENNLKRIATFNHQLVGLLGNQLQIAVDGPKSAARPDALVLDLVRETLSNYRTIAWLKDYKDEAAYFERAMNTNSYSPIDRLILTVNQQFEKHQLAPRPSHQFRPLFSDVSYTEQHKELASKLRNEHNQLYEQAHRIENARDEDSGIRLTLTSPKGNQLEVIDLANTNHPKTFNSEQMNIKIRFDERKEKYGVFAEVIGKKNQSGQPQYRRIGYLSKDSSLAHQKTIDQLFDESGWAKLGVLKTQLKPGITQEAVKAAFTHIREYDEQAYLKIPESERLPVAAALWDLSHTRTNKVDERSFRKGTAAYQIFPNEINARLAQLQFGSIEISKLREPTNQHDNRHFQGEVLPIEVQFVTDPNDPNHNQRVLVVEGKVLGTFAQDSPQLPNLTTALATVNTVRGSGVNAVTHNGQTLQVGVLKNYAYAETDFQLTEAHLTFETIKNQLNRTVLAARLDGLLLGEIKDVNTKNYLKEKGYIDSGESLNVTLTRDAPSIAKIMIDPSTVIYPLVQTHDKALSTSPSRSPEILPTLWSKSDEGITLAVDNRKTENVVEFFDRYSVPVTFAQDAPIERELGYTVVKFENLSDLVYSKLQAKFGEPLSKEDYSKALQGSGSAVVVSKPSVSLKGVEPTPLVISGKPVAMNYDLKLHGEPNPLKVSTTIEAIRGHGRTHTTRNFEPYMAYSFKEGDYAIAYSGTKENPTQQVLFQVGKQYQITDKMIKDEQYRQTWAKSEKHSALELDTFQGKTAWGLYYEPIGDYKDGKVYSFQTGQEITALQKLNHELKPNPEGFLEARQLEKVQNLEQPQGILGVSVGIIVQQVNCKKVMGAGLASSISDRYPQVKEAYLAKENWSLGDVQFVKVSDRLMVANVAGQDDYGTNKRQTDFVALKQGLSEVARFAQTSNKPVYLPFRLGSGLAGGATENERLATWKTVQAIIREVLPNARIVDSSWKGANKNAETPIMASSPTNAQKIQAQRTKTIAPILMDLLNCKLATEYQGEKYTAIFDPDTQNISCYRSETKQLTSQAQFRSGQWHPLPILLSDSNEPNLTQQDFEFFTQTLAPQLLKHQEQYRQIYQTMATSFSDLEPTELDTAIAFRMLEDNHSINQICLTLNQFDTFKELSPAEAIDYRQQIVDDALQLFEEQQERNQKDWEL